MSKIAFAFAVCIFLLAGCTQVGERTQLSVGYYDIYGTNFRQLDQQIALHGPNVEGVGKALAATRVRMIPDVRYQKKNGICEVTKAKVKVQAKVTLPRLSNRRTVNTDIRQAWNNLEEYARVHEAVHVAIADKYAVLIEKELLQLEGQQTCELLEKIAQEKAKELLAEHEADQLQFDRDENDRINKLIRRKNTSG